MQPIRTVLLISLLCAATQADAERRPTRHFDVVNAAHDSVTSLAVAPAGSADFRPVELDPPLRGGNTSATVELAEGDCLRDLLVGFRDGRTLLYPKVDVCRYRRLRLTAMDGKPRHPAGADDRSAQGPTSP